MAQSNVHTNVAFMQLEHTSDYPGQGNALAGKTKTIRLNKVNIFRAVSLTMRDHINSRLCFATLSQTRV